MKHKRIDSVAAVGGFVSKLRERATWLESRSFATLDGSIERQAASAIEELAGRYDVALNLLRRAYQLGHREGWEDGESCDDVFESINDFLSSEELEQEIFESH